MCIPATHAEIEQIYMAAELADCHSLCITACQTGEGVTSVASALAERYLLAGHQTLLVDLNLFNPAFRNLELTINSNQQQEYWIENKETHQLFTGLAIPNERATQLAYKDPNTMAKAVAGWMSKFDRVIVDTSPLLQVNKGNIPAQSVASACDKTILVVMGGATTSGQISTAMNLLQSEKIDFLGSVLNIKNQPPLSQELVRELDRIPFIPQSWRERINHWLLKNNFLSVSA
ncbi:chromosome partitioning protein ParA [Vibrio sp. S12_S33]|uniref:chromosome partitioning protein ParA n=1 Tax=Vibrio sp. S12_S33 TaxID=2720223 RepID=UPI0017871CD9|nr:chromosome partitioning protein ParA [Vibrio sp. S12_S33]MBD1564391.1 CpsD/CapB family tyrosine-protein kinase [Vibrio sp. S12_S33]